MAARTVQTRSIEIVHSHGAGKSLVENIPANAKITLGPVSLSKNDYNNRDMALRIYTTAGNQLAVFRDVISFRDLSLTLKVQQVKTTSEESSEHGPKGSKRAAVSETAVDWVDA